MRFSNWFIVLAVTVFADCPTDGVWSATKPGVTKSVTCEGETWGEMYRACIADGATGTWGNPDTQYCLPLYPAEGYGYVDFYYYISNSDYRRIQSNPSGIAAAVSTVSTGVPQEEVSVHYVVRIMAHLMYKLLITLTHSIRLFKFVATRTNVRWLLCSTSSLSLMRLLLK